MLTEPHFAIIEFTSVWIPGDERSRTNPGHGYPEHNEDVVNYIAFTDEAEWKAEINKRMTSPYGGEKNNFIAARVTPASIQVQTVINVKD
jgi:hypothetical protein